jgi:nitroreductase
MINIYELHLGDEKMLETNNEIAKAIIRSQHCQRNWDLTREIPKEDLDLFMTAITQCPSKQNIAHYRIHAITNRQLIEQIHEQTKGFTTSVNPYAAETNSQVLANLLVVFEHQPVVVNDYDSLSRTDETRRIATGKMTDMDKAILLRDAHMAVGIAAGYLNVVASMLDYSTGCCACFSSLDIQKILGLENEIVLMMGVGYRNPEMNRRIHHTNHDFMFPTKTKQVISVTHYN